MEYVEAIEILKRGVASVSAIYSRYYGDNIPCVMKRDIDSFNVAIAAVDKQIPKPVKYNNRHGDGADLWNKDYFNCPACGRRLRNKKPDPYCPRCGQALEWERR